MTTEPLDDIKYWAHELDLNREKLLTLNKSYNCNEPYFQLDAGELYMLNALAVETAVLTRFLVEAIAKYEKSLKRKRPFWKKFLK